MKYRVRFLMGGDLTGNVWSKPYDVEATDRTGAILLALSNFPEAEQERLKAVPPKVYRFVTKLGVVGEDWRPDTAADFMGRR